VKKLHFTAAGRIEDILIAFVPICLRVNVDYAAVSKINNQVFHSHVLQSTTNMKSAVRISQWPDEYERSDAPTDGNQ
jgi:hypothetical protein